MAGNRGIVTIVVVMMWALLPTAGRASGDGDSGGDGCGNGGCPSGQTACGDGCMPDGSSCCPNGTNNCPAPSVCNSSNVCVTPGGPLDCPKGTYQVNDQCVADPGSGGGSSGGSSGGGSGGGSGGSGCTAEYCCGGAYECNGACYSTCVVGSQPCCTETICVCYTPCC